MGVLRREDLLLAQQERLTCSCIHPILLPSWHWPACLPLLPQVTKKVTSPLPTTDAIFYAGTGTLLARSEDKVALFDVQQRSTGEAAGAWGGVAGLGLGSRWGRDGRFLGPAGQGSGAGRGFPCPAGVLPGVGAIPGHPVTLGLAALPCAVAELSTPPIKYVVWSGDMSHVALLR